MDSNGENDEISGPKQLLKCDVRLHPIHTEISNSESHSISSKNKNDKVNLLLPLQASLDTSEYFDANESPAKSTAGDAIENLEDDDSDASNDTLCDSVVDDEMNNTLNDESILNESKGSIDSNVKDEIEEESSTLGNVDRPKDEANDESQKESNGDSNARPSANDIMVPKMDDILNGKSDEDDRCNEDLPDQADKWFNINQG